MLKSSEITALKQAEQALLKSELRLNEVQRIAKMGSWELDLVSGKLVWSDEVFRIFEIDQTVIDGVLSFSVQKVTVRTASNDAGVIQ